MLFALITSQAVRDVQAIAAPYVEQVNNRVDDIQVTIGESVTIEFGTLRLPTSFEPLRLAESTANLLGLTISPR